MIEQDIKHVLREMDRRLRSVLCNHKPLRYLNMIGIWRD